MVELPGQFSYKSYAPMGFIQFTSVFIDYAYKTIALFAALSVLGEQDYANQSAFLALLAISYTLPFVIGGGLAGYFADRFAKTQILIAVKIAEIIFLLLGFYALQNVGEFGTFPLLIVMFLISAQSLFLSPAFNGLIPEKFGEHGAAQANGITGLVSSVAVLLGSAVGCILADLMSGSYENAIWALMPLSVLGVVMGCVMKKSHAANPSIQLKWSWFWTQFSDALALRKHRSVFLSILGDAFFCALSTVVLSVLTVFMINHLNVDSSDSLSIGVTQLMIGVGVGIGSLLAGNISKGRIELALVPIGALGLAVTLILIPLCPGSSFLVGDVHIFPWLSTWLLGLGLFGGLFIVPLRAFLQCRVSPQHIGGVLASANIICFTAMMVSSFFVFYLTSGIPQESIGLFPNTVLEFIQKSCLMLTPTPLFFILSILSLLVIVGAVLQMPEMMLRALNLVIGRLIYRVRLSGLGKIPEEGPVLIIANHITVWDALLLSHITTRPIRFVMDTTYMHTRWLRYVAKVCGFIELEPDADTPHGLRVLCHKIRASLEDGEVVCVFPEGRMNRAGNISGFNSGYRALIPRDGRIPVIPVRIGFMWGSAFSPYFGDGKIRLRIPRRLPLPVNITVGEPIPDARSTTPFQLRCMISDLSAFAEMDPRPEEVPLHTHFCRTMRKHAFAPLITDHTDKVLKGIEYWTASVLLSKEIRKLANEDEYVAILLPNCIGMAVTVMGTLMADKTPAMLNFTAGEEARDISLQKVNNPIILTSKQFLSKANIAPFGRMIYLEDIVKNITKFEKIKTLLQGLFLPHQILEKMIFPKTRLDVRKAGVILFSSGSTGIPKAVELSHHALNENVYAMLHVMGWRKSDRMMGSLPTFHSYGFTTGFWIPMTTLSLVAYVPSPLDAETLGRVFKKNKMTLLLATPTFLQNYIRKCPSDTFEHLRLAIVGGEKMRPHIAEQFKEKFGIYPIEGYGSTELAPVVCINMSRTPPDFTIVSGKEGSIGPALPNLTVRVTSPDSLEQLPANTEGLFRVKGPSIMTGYLGDPELTAKVIEDGWYNTGDLAKIDEEGYVFITGRQSRFSKIGGEMVPHERIEQVLQEMMPDADKRIVAVSSVPDRDKGERIIVIYTPDFTVIPDEAIARMREIPLPNLWIPKVKDFYQVEEIPLLGAGKLDLKKLKDIVLEIAASV